MRTQGISTYERPMPASPGRRTTNPIKPSTCRAHVWCGWGSLKLERVGYEWGYGWNSET